MPDSKLPMPRRAKVREGRGGRFFRPLLRSLLGLSLGVSAYLAWAALGGTAVAGCGPESGCDQVLHSRWSAWFGIPVSLPALAVYATALWMTFRLDAPTPPPVQRRAWAVLIVCGAAMLGAVLWFMVVQAAVLRTFCPYCLAVHGAGALAAGLILVTAPVAHPQGQGRKLRQEVVLPPGSARRLILIAGVGVAVLVAGQVAYRPKTFRVTPLAKAGANPSVTNGLRTGVTDAPGPGVVPGTSSPTDRSAAPRLPGASTRLSGQRVYSLYGGAVQLDLTEVPLLGLPSAPVILISLRDYSCHHCRTMHGYLQQVHQALGDQLAIVSLPVPLNSECNAVVRRTHPDHVNACTYARLALAVWRTDRTSLARFDEWMLTPERPPTPADAGAFAAQLVGTNALRLALQDPWIDRQLHLGVSIYATNSLYYRQSRMPQTILGQTIVTGAVNGPHDLYALLAKQPGVRWPATPRADVP